MKNKLTSESPGAVVIFNFAEFRRELNLEPRPSSIEDVKNLLNLFHGMNLSIHVSKASTLYEFREEIEELSKCDFSRHASFQLVFMSHGKEDNILYCENGEFDFVEITLEILERNRTLHNKPTFLIVEACKGEMNTDWIYRPQSLLHRDTYINLVGIVTSSFEGFISFIGDDGANYVRTFVEVVKENWTKKPYCEVLKLVTDTFNENLDRDDDEEDREQTAVYHPLCRGNTFSFKEFAETYRVKH